MENLIFDQENVNLHTHSKYCGHGIGEIEDYVDFAKKNTNLKVLGFSEHAPSPVDRWPEASIPTDKLSEYEKAVDDEKKKNKDLIILKGLECDWIPALTSYYKDELLGEHGFDYLIGSSHYYINNPPKDGRRYSLYLYAPNDKEIIKQYVKIYTKTLETGLFLFGAHPDLYLAGYLYWDDEAKAVAKEILQCAKDLNIPLEINGNGFRKGMIDTPSGKRKPYPVDKFWELASEYGIRVTTNSDAHAPKNVNDSWIYCKNFADKFNLKFVKWEINKEGKIFAL